MQMTNAIAFKVENVHRHERAALERANCWHVDKWQNGKQDWLGPLCMLKMQHTIVAS